MSDENVKIEKEECKCFCRSEGFRNFLITALGTFVGFYCAISLFAALHKPPMMCPIKFRHHMHPAIEYRQDFNVPPRPDFHGQRPIKPEQRTPFEAPVRK